MVTKLSHWATIKTSFPQCRPKYSMRIYRVGYTRHEPCRWCWIPITCTPYFLTCQKYCLIHNENFSQRLLLVILRCSRGSVSLSFLYV